MRPSKLIHGMESLIIFFLGIFPVSEKSTETLTPEKKWETNEMNSENASESD